MFFGLLWSFADAHCSQWDTILKRMTAGGARKGKKGKQHHVEGHPLWQRWVQELNSWDYLSAVKEEIVAQLGSLTFVCEGEAEQISAWAVLACYSLWDCTQVENPNEVCAAALAMMFPVAAEVKLLCMDLSALQPCHLAAWVSPDCSFMVPR